MILTENPKFCRGCPMLPKGVTAEVTGAEEATMQQPDVSHLPPSSAIGAAYGLFLFSERRIVRVQAAVTASDSPQYQPGDTLEILFQTHRKGADEVQNSIGACTTPRKNLVDNLLRTRGACGVIT